MQIGNKTDASSSHAAISSSGFTLIEIIVVVFIFSIVMTVAYSGLSSFLSLSKTTQQSNQRQQEIIATLSFLQNDFRYMVDRSTRDDFGDTEAAFSLSDLDSAEEVVALTTLRPDFLYQNSVLPQRVVWLLRDQNLIRKYWHVVDGRNESQQAQVAFLKDIASFSIRPITVSGANNSNRFATNLDNGISSKRLLNGQKIADIPDAVSVNLKFTDGYELERVIEVVVSNQ